MTQRNANRDLSLTVILSEAEESATTELSVDKILRLHFVTLRMTTLHICVYLRLSVEKLIKG